MAKDFSMDTKKIDKMLFKLRRTLPKEMPKIITKYVNSMGAVTKKNTEKTLNKFDFMNSSTKKFTNRGVMFNKAKMNRAPISEVGATGDLDGDSRKSRKASYLARQELGGKVTQIKSSGGLRNNLLAPNPGNMKKKRLMRLRGKVGIAKKGLNNRRGTASALQNARKNNKRFAITPYGVYRVTKRSAKLMIVNKPQGSIKTPKKSWLQPAVKMTLKKKDAIFRKEILRLKFKMQGK